MKRILAVLTVVAMLFILSACGQSNTPEKAAENFVLALYTADPEKMINCIPEFIVRELASQYGTNLNDIEGLINLMSAQISQEDISDCVITSSNISSDLSLLDEYKENMDNYGVTTEDFSKIEEYSLVNVLAEVDDEDIENIVFCVKYDGVWCAVDID